MRFCPGSIPIHDVSYVLHIEYDITPESIEKSRKTSKKSLITQGFFVKYAIIALHEGELRLQRAGDP